MGNVYKKRWLMEVLLKWVKEDVKIKKLWGRREKGVGIEMSVGIMR